MAALARLNSPLECLRAPFLLNRVIRGSNKIVYEHNEERTCLLHSVKKVLGLSTDYDPTRIIKVLDHPTPLFSSLRDRTRSWLTCDKNGSILDGSRFFKEFGLRNANTLNRYLKVIQQVPCHAVGYLRKNIVFAKHENSSQNYNIIVLLWKISSCRKKSESRYGSFFFI